MDELERLAKTIAWTEDHSNWVYQLRWRYLLWKAKRAKIAAMTAPKREVTFQLQFLGCGHVLTLPLLHSANHQHCYVCQPELRDRPEPGLCPRCQGSPVKPSGR
jgi:hypothetical protein